MPSLADLATDHATERSPRTLAALRRAVLALPGYDPGADPVGAAVPHLAAGDHAAALVALRELMPGAFFSPGAHAALAAAHAGLGDEVRAERERRTARLAMTSVLESGDGSADRPWLVLRVSDEYDVLRAQDRTSRRVADVSRDAQRLDHHWCTDGSEAWFATGEWR